VLGLVIRVAHCMVLDVWFTYGTLTRTFTIMEVPKLS